MRIRKWIAHGGGEGRTQLTAAARAPRQPALTCPTPVQSVPDFVPPLLGSPIRPPSINGRHTVKRVMLDLRLDFRSRSRAPRRFPEVGR